MKIGIIGIGTVGSAIATAIHGTGLVREMVLIDTDEFRAAAAAEDLGHAATFGFDINVHAGTYRDLRGAEIVIIAAGQNQKPGQTRDDLLTANTAVMRDVIPKLMQFADPNIKIIMVTNPLDVMVMVARELSDLPPARVIGTGTMLDSARLRTELARALAVSPASVNAYVIGEHGDASVVNWHAATIGNIPLENVARQMRAPMTTTTRRAIEYRVRNAAYEIIKGRSATWDGIAAAAADLVRTIINDERRIQTVSMFDGLVAMSLPRIVGADGVIATLTPALSPTESRALTKAGEIIREHFHGIK